MSKQFELGSCYFDIILLFFGHPNHCMNGTKVTAMYGLQMGEFFISVKLARGGSTTNGATSSNYVFY